MGWATFWAILSQTYLVTLGKSRTLKQQNRNKVEIFFFRDTVFYFAPVST
jgi:hypothetical protein